MSESILHSIIESKILGLRIGRYNTLSIDNQLITKNAENFDLIRVKTSCKDEFAVQKMYETKIPFFFSGGVRRYRVNCFEAPLQEYTHMSIGFEKCTEKHRDILYYIMKDSWGEYPLGYYRTPIINEFVTKERELECLFQYYIEFYTNNSPLNHLWLMYFENKPVGFLALNNLEDGVDSTIAGILKSFQNNGLFPNILRFIRKYCRENGLKYFNCGARLENIYSQRAFENDFMKAVDNEYIYHIVNINK